MDDNELPEHLAYEDYESMSSSEYDNGFIQLGSFFGPNWGRIKQEIIDLIILAAEGFLKEFKDDKFLNFPGAKFEHKKKAALKAVLDSDGPLDFWDPQKQLISDVFLNKIFEIVKQKYDSKLNVDDSKSNNPIDFKIEFINKIGDIYYEPNLLLHNNILDEIDQCFTNFLIESRTNDEYLEAKYDAFSDRSNDLDFENDSVVSFPDEGEYEDSTDVEEDKPPIDESSHQYKALKEKTSKRISVILIESLYKSIPTVFNKPFIDEISRDIVTNINLNSDRPMRDQVLSAFDDQRILYSAQLKGEGDQPTGLFRRGREQEAEAILWLKHFKNPSEHPKSAVLQHAFFNAEGKNKNDINNIYVFFIAKILVELKKSINSEEVKLRNDFVQVLRKNMVDVPGLFKSIKGVLLDEYSTESYANQDGVINIKHQVLTLKNEECLNKDKRTNNKRKELKCVIDSFLKANLTNSLNKQYSKAHRTLLAENFSLKLIEAYNQFPYTNSKNENDVTLRIVNKALSHLSIFTSHTFQELKSAISTISSSVVIIDLFSTGEPTSAQEKKKGKLLNKITYSDFLKDTSIQNTIFTNKSTLYAGTEYEHIQNEWMSRRKGLKLAKKVSIVNQNNEWSKLCECFGEKYGLLQKINSYEENQDTTITYPLLLNRIMLQFNYEKLLRINGQKKAGAMFREIVGENIEIVVSEAREVLLDCINQSKNINSDLEILNDPNKEKNQWLKNLLGFYQHYFDDKKIEDIEKIELNIINSKYFKYTFIHAFGLNFETVFQRFLNNIKSKNLVGDSMYEKLETCAESDISGYVEKLKEELLVLCAEDAISDYVEELKKELMALSNTKGVFRALLGEVSKGQEKDNLTRQNIENIISVDKIYNFILELLNQYDKKTIPTMMLMLKDKGISIDSLFDDAEDNYKEHVIKTLRNKEDINDCMTKNVFDELSKQVKTADKKNTIEDIKQKEEENNNENVKSFFDELIKQAETDFEKEIIEGLRKNEKRKLKVMFSAKERETYNANEKLCARVEAVVNHRNKISDDYKDLFIICYLLSRIFNIKACEFETDSWYNKTFVSINAKTNISEAVISYVSILNENDYHLIQALQFSRWRSNKKGSLIKKTMYTPSVRNIGLQSEALVNFINTRCNLERRITKLLNPEGAIGRVNDFLK